jgi:hypothetical protein
MVAPRAARSQILNQFRPPADLVPGQSTRKQLAVHDSPYGILFVFLFPCLLEEHDMHRADRYIASIFLAAGLVAPVSLMAAPKPQDAKVQVRVYDKDHKDYHNWDDHENAAWGRFLVENHRQDHEYAKADKKEQKEYWNWRHSHPD